MIEKLQNEKYALELLAAQRQAYSLAKGIRNFRVAGDILIPVIGSVLVVAIPEYKANVGLAVLLWFILQVFFNRQEKACKVDGANIQEMFDTYVFSIPRNMLSQEVSPENIYRYLTKYFKKNEEFIGLENWYSVSGQADKNKEILLCQRQNVMWSTDHVSKSQFLILVIALMLLVFSIISAYITNALVADFVIRLFVLLPLIRYLIQTHIAIGENTRSLANCRNKIENGLKMSLNTSFVREMQDLIYQYRITSVLIPEWFYWFHKNRNQQETDNAIKNLGGRV